MMMMMMNINEGHVYIHVLRSVPVFRHRSFESDECLEMGGRIRDRVDQVPNDVTYWAEADRITAKGNNLIMILASGDPCQTV